MKELDILVDIAAIRQLIRDILLGIKEQYTKASNILATNATIS